MQKTAKLWCGTPPASTPSVRLPNRAPVMYRNRSSIESPDRPGADLVQARAADPVGLHDPAVQRVVRPVAPGDQLEVGPCPGELLGHRPQPAVVHARRRRTRRSRRSRPARRSRASWAGRRSGRTAPAPGRRGRRRPGPRPAGVVPRRGPSAPGPPSPARRPAASVSSTREAHVDEHPLAGRAAARRAGRCSPCRATPSTSTSASWSPKPGHHLDDPSRDPEAHLRPPPPAAVRRSPGRARSRTASSTAASTGGVSPIPSPVSATWHPTRRVRGGQSAARARPAWPARSPGPCRARPPGRPRRRRPGRSPARRRCRPSPPVGQRVDQDQRVPGVEQVVGQVQAADAVVDHPDAVGPGQRGRAAGRPPTRTRRRSGRRSRSRRPGPALPRSVTPAVPAVRSGPPWSCSSWLTSSPRVVPA